MTIKNQFVRYLPYPDINDPLHETVFLADENGDPATLDAPKAGEFGVEPDFVVVVYGERVPVYMAADNPLLLLPPGFQWLPVKAGNVVRVLTRKRNPP
jgi:hypothetical protein